jgi:hypothetical protein
MKFFGKKRHGQPKRRLRKQPTRLGRMESTGVTGRKKKSVASKSVISRRKNMKRKKWEMPALALRKIIVTSRWVSFGLFLLTSYAIYFISSNGGFYINSIPVVGAQVIPANEVLLASELGGVHIFAADPNDVANKIIDSVPGVISATVSLEWPNIVEITIGEDAPVAMWEENGKQFWVNSGGKLIPARVPIPNLLTIRSEVTTADIALDLEEVELAEGEEAPPPNDLINDFVAEDVLEGARQLKILQPQANFFYYRPAGGLSFDDPRGWRAYFGVANDMEQKQVVYDVLVNQILANNQQPVYISVSNQEKPYYLAQ